MKTTLHAACALLLITGAHATGPGQVVSWNRQLLEVAEAEDRLLTLKGVRAAAMMHLAMHDALNSIHARYAVYALDAEGRGADPQAAAAQAAFAVAVDQYPGESARWSRERDRWLARANSRHVRERSIALGNAAANRVLEKRRDDGWNREASYQFHPMAPGVYAEFNEHSGTPEGFVFGAGWALVQPFAMRAPCQFRAPAPPDVASEQYTHAFNEVKELGHFASATRSADQAHLAMWWKEFAEASHNRLARQLVSAGNTDLWSATRLFALLNVGIFDGYISSFDSKFHYNHWRPYTAIRWAEHDGNPGTVADPDWNNLHRHTYAFPSYPSAHGAVCAAAMTVLADTFGDRRRIRMETAQVDSAGPGSPKVAMQPPFRRFDSFSEAAMECAMSRVYLGIHFRYDSIEGNRHGREVGEYVVAQMLRPARD
jgi:membrane-associated phospholipid phosphatase